jgi:hypothetical protein
MDIAMQLPNSLDVDDSPRLAGSGSGRQSLAHMIDRLRLSQRLTLPLDAMRQTFSVIAPRGGAKTHPATVLVEEMVADGLPVVILDPRGIWHALRRATDGSSSGLSVHVLGGPHGESQLSEHAGAMAADWVIERALPVVIDLSSMSRAGACRFVADFVDETRFRGPSAMHVVLDEADTLLDNGGNRANSVTDFLRWARGSGVGVTLVSPRADLLRHVPGVDVLIAGRPRDRADRALIGSWIQDRVGRTVGRQVEESLGFLATDEAWVCSPTWLRVVERVRLRRRATYDATRRGAAARRPPLSPASTIELQRLRTRLGESGLGPLLTERGPTLTMGATEADAPTPVTSNPNAADSKSARPGSGRRLASLRLAAEERELLRRRAGEWDAPAAWTLRARIVLACAEGRRNWEVARELDVSSHTVGKWRRRFVARGLAGLASDAVSGAAPATAHHEP